MSQECSVSFRISILCITLLHILKSGIMTTIGGAISSTNTSNGVLRLTELGQERQQQKRKKKKERQQRRHLVYDEDLGETVVRRRRKGGRDREEWEDVDF